MIVSGLQGVDQGALRVSIVGHYSPLRGVAAMMYHSWNAFRLMKYEPWPVSAAQES